MDGKFSQSGNDYQWWAGKSDEDVNKDFCVHCRREKYGITQYMSDDVSDTEAEAIAKTLAPMIERLA